jgi:hypothetical protein
VGSGPSLPPTCRHVGSCWHFLWTGLPGRSRACLPGRSGFALLELEADLTIRTAYQIGGELAAGAGRDKSTQQFAAAVGEEPAHLLRLDRLLQDDGTGAEVAGSAVGDGPFADVCHAVAKDARATLRAATERFALREVWLFGATVVAGATLAEIEDRGIVLVELDDGAERASRACCGKPVNGPIRASAQATASISPPLRYCRPATIFQSEKSQPWHWNFL